MRQRLPLILTILLLVGCATPTPPPADTVTLIVDGETRTLTVGPGSTINDLLRENDITLGDLDQINPPGFTPVTDGLTITIVRVDEETVVEEQVIPFERRRTVNDSLPAGEQQLLQAGVNGLAEVTYRITYRDGVEVGRSEVRRVLIEPAQDEVIMVGSQSTLPTITVNGSVFYISGGNVWVVRQNSANRRPLTINGGLDERVLALSEDGLRLLFTRSAGAGEDAPATDAPEETPIPTATAEGPEAAGAFGVLWAILDTTDPDARPLRLDVENVLYAEWVPGTQNTILYSTAEPRDEFPGWQANNDLWSGQVTATGEVVNRRLLLEPSSGGSFGFYGMTFAISPDASTLAFAQPDAVGVLSPVFEPPPAEEDEDDDAPQPTPTVTPEVPVESSPLLAPTRYEMVTRVSFAPRTPYDFFWRPDPVWSPDGEIVVTGTHGPPLGAEAPEDSPVFDLAAFLPGEDYTVTLAEQVGLFALPRFAPVPNTAGEILLAYLQAEEPLQSNSRYRLVVMDRDGSNPRAIFPPAEQTGLGPQVFAWSPDGRQIAVVYRGDVYLVDSVTGLSQQLTGDGLVTSVRWAP